MRFNRFAVASAAAVLTLGTTALLPALAGAQETTTTAPPGPNETVTNATLSCFVELLNATVDFPLTVTVTAPGGLEVGDTGDLSIEYVLGIPADLGPVVDANPSTMTDLSLVANLTGGGTGGPYAASPSTFNPVTSAGITTSASGSFTITSTADALLTLTSPVTFSVNTLVGGTTPLTIDMSCPVSPTNIAALTGTLPPVPPTTPPTTASNAAVETNPTFTG